MHHFVDICVYLHHGRTWMCVLYCAVLKSQWFCLLYFLSHQFSLRCCFKLKLARICSQVSGSHLDEKQVRSIVDEIKQVLTASSSRKHERAERAKEEDFDAEERELLKEENEQEEELFDQVCWVICFCDLNHFIKYFFYVLF